MNLHRILSLDAVTPEWLTAALAQRYPGTKVESFETGTIIRGMATKAQLFLTYADGAPAGLPPSMWLKCGFEAHSERSVPLYRAEVQFYHDLAGAIPINCARSYFEDVEGRAGNGVLLLEDLSLRQARFGQPGEQLTVAQVERILTLLSWLHSLPAVQPDVKALPWVAMPGAIDSVDVVAEYFGFWDDASGRPRFRHLPAPMRDRDRMFRALRAMRALDTPDGREWLLHGDCHAGNLFFEPDGALGLLDWQTVMLGHWASDVSYCLITSLSIEDRRLHERRLLQHYLDALEARCGARIAFEDAWFEYRRRAAWCFLTTLCPVERHPETVVDAWASRTAAALSDLQTVEALIGE